jgi:DNA-binding transcriptional LysR family regulator
MDLNGLRAFLAVIDAGSFLGAAEALTISRSTIRRRIEALEEAAGTPLLVRERQGIEPTEASLLLAERGKRMVQEVSALLASLGEVGDQPAGVLRVMLPVGLPPQVILGLLTQLRARLPQLRFRIKMSANPLSGLLDDVDLAFYIGTASPQGPWISHSLMIVRERLLAHRGYLARHGLPAQVTDLRQHSLLAWDSSDTDPSVWPTVSAGNLRVEPRVITTDAHLLHQLALQQLGIAFLPDIPAPWFGIPQTDLLPVLPAEVHRERRLRVVVPEALAQIPRIKAVLSLLVEHLMLLPVLDRPDSLPALR